MKKLKLLIISGLSLFFGCTPTSQDSKWTELLNGNDLSNWDTYLSPRYNAEIGDFDGEPVGLNVDPRNVFSLVNLDGETALRISGSEFGGISTKEEFQNYHLRLKMKWGDEKHPPRTDKSKDSGLIFHAHEPHGFIADSWMQGQEFQIKHERIGDYVCFGSIMDVPSSPEEGRKNGVFDEEGELRSIYNKGPFGKRVHINSISENPDGEWNTLDLYCLGDSSIFLVNGILKMKMYNSRQIFEGKEASLTKGKIQLQSEGAEVFYKDMRIRSIDAMPADF
jgi:hypothetical protein